MAHTSAPLRLAFTGCCDRFLEAELQLAPFEWSADGNERTMTELRRDIVTVGYFDLLLKNGHVIRERKEEIETPYDEYVAEFHVEMTRSLRKIQRTLDRTDWDGVTLKTLFDHHS